MKKLSELMSEQAVKQHQLSVARFEAINNECMDIYARKNLDYGNSFDISLDEDGLLVAKIRLGDKMKRFASLIKNPQQVKDESIRDTLIDMANYAKMTVMWMDAQEAQGTTYADNTTYDVPGEGLFVKDDGQTVLRRLY